MSTTEISDPLIEKAALGMWEHEPLAPTWDRLTGRERKMYRERARTALSAVADDLRAEGAREALGKYAESQRERSREAVRKQDYTNHAFCLVAADYADRFTVEYYPTTEGEQ